MRLRVCIADSFALFVFCFARPPVMPAFHFVHSQALLVHYLAKRFAEGVAVLAHRFARYSVCFLVFDSCLHFTTKRVKLNKF